jgi:hypothetical protein
MEYQLSITWVTNTDKQGHQFRSPIMSVMAEISLGASPQLDTPITGKLLGLTLVQITELKFSRRGVEVSFEGKRYTFSQLEKDGTFELGKDW